MKGLFLIAFISIFLFAEKIQYIDVCTNNFGELSQNQIENLKKAYRLGEPAGYAFVMAAIAWHESCAGEVKINIQDPSAGLFHTYLPNVFDRNPHLARSGLNQNIVSQMLIRDDEFSARECIAELDAWKKQHNGNLKNMIKSYNKGNSWQRDQKANLLAEGYYASVSKKMEMLQKMLFSPTHIAPKSTQPNIMMASKETRKGTSEQAVYSGNRVLEMPIYSSASKVITPKAQPVIKFVPKNTPPKVAMNMKEIDKTKLMYE